MIPAVIAPSFEQCFAFAEFVHTDGEAEKQDRIDRVSSELDGEIRYVLDKARKCRVLHGSDERKGDPGDNAGKVFDPDFHGCKDTQSIASRQSEVGVNVSFLISAAVCFLFVLTPTLLNFARVRKHSIHIRLAVLGASIDACIALFSVVYGELVPPSFLIFFALSTFCWLSGLLFLSYLMELTSARRPRWFCIYYFLSLVLAYVSVRIPVRWGLQALSIFGLAVCSLWAFSFLASWIRAATDTRARGATANGWCSFSPVLRSAFWCVYTTCIPA